MAQRLPTKLRTELEINVATYLEGRKGRVTNPISQPKFAKIPSIHSTFCPDPFLLFAVFLFAIPSPSDPNPIFPVIKKKQANPSPHFTLSSPSIYKVANCDSNESTRVHGNKSGEGQGYLASTL